MAAFKINKLKPGTKAVFSEADIIKLATEVTGPNPLGTEGLTINKMKKILNHSKLKMKGWQYKRIPRKTVPEKLIKTVGTTGGLGPVLNVNPMIVMVDWKKGGSHFVLVDTVRTFNGSYYATVCDPWDADVHIVKIEKKKQMDYTGQKGAKVDFGGTHYEYDTANVGRVFDGDVFWR